MLTPVLHKLLPNIAIFRGFTKILILIEYSNIFHWKSAKKAKWMWSNGQNVGQIRSNVVKSTKKLSIALAIDFFHILQKENI